MFTNSPSVQNPSDDLRLVFSCRSVIGFEIAPSKRGDLSSKVFEVRAHLLVFVAEAVDPFEGHWGLTDDSEGCLGSRYPVSESPRLCGTFFDSEELCGGPVAHLRNVVCQSHSPSSSTVRVRLQAPHVHE